MDSKALLAGGLMLLILFGCIGTQRERTVPGSGLGDSDISSQAQGDQDLLPGDDLIPPPSVGAFAFSDSDLAVEQVDDVDLIAEGDVIEPA